MRLPSSATLFRAGLRQVFLLRRVRRQVEKGGRLVLEVEDQLVVAPDHGPKVGLAGSFGEQRPAVRIAPTLEQAAPAQRRVRIETEDVEQRRVEVDQGYGLVSPAWSALRELDQKRDANQLLVERAGVPERPVIQELLPVITRHHDDRIVEAPV